MIGMPHFGMSSQNIIAKKIKPIIAKNSFSAKKFMASNNQSQGPQQQKIHLNIEVSRRSLLIA